ncbi:MAG: 16S rRNA (cytidine(1402)-2'-O)-methyltransferase [Thermoanaerobaculia bacterium]
MAGTLQIVSTPIGNLDDLSPRAVEALKRADVVACEDTRHSGRLLAHLGLKRPLVSLHEHNERTRTPELLDRLEDGETIALVSDAGTPLISDPGFVLVRAAIERGLPVTAIPGPSAALAALALSGLPPYPATFTGFAPRKAGKRRRFFAELAALPHTLVVFESPHRILACLDDAAAELGDRPAALARELTKLHEEVVRGTLSAIRNELAARPSVKGEMVLVIHGAD